MPGFQEYAVSFRVRHPTADPMRIARRLAWTAHRFWKVGEARKDGAGRPLPGVYRDSYCSFRLATARQTSLPVMLEVVLTHLVKRRALLLDLKKSGARLTLWVAVYVTTPSGDEIDAYAARQFGELGVGFAVSVSPFRMPAYERKADNVVKVARRRTKGVGKRTLPRRKSVSAAE